MYGNVAVVVIYMTNSHIYMHEQKIPVPSADPHTLALYRHVSLFPRRVLPCIVLALGLNGLSASKSPLPSTVSAVEDTVAIAIATPITWGRNIRSRDRCFWTRPVLRRQTCHLAKSPGR